MAAARSPTDLSVGELHEMVAFSIRIPVSMRARLEVLAGKNRRSLNQELLWRLEQALKNADSDSQKAGPQDLN